MWFDLSVLRVGVVGVRDEGFVLDVPHSDGGQNEPATLAKKNRTPVKFQIDSLLKRECSSGRGTCSKAWICNWNAGKAFFALAGGALCA